MNMRTLILLCVLGLTLLCVGCQSGPRIKVADKLASEARQQLLAPPRHEIRLSMVDVPTAVREIQRIYGWTLSPDMNLEEDFDRVKDVRVTIDREAGSLAEVLADLCNQTGFSTFEDFENIGIYGAIGHEEVGGRGSAFAKDGILLSLSLNISYNDKVTTFSIAPQIIDAVPWLYHEDARLRIDELVYPDETSVRDLKDGPVIDDIPFEPLASNQGQIKSIRGVLSIQLPLHVIVEDICLEKGAIPKESRSDNHFVRINELNETKEGWQLSCEVGYYSLEREDVRLDYGHVDVLDENGIAMEGVYQGVGSGSGSSGGWPAYTNENYKTFEIEFPRRPTSIRWTYVTETETYSIPFLFTDFKVPDVIWNQDWEEKRAQLTPITNIDLGPTQDFLQLNTGEMDYETRYNDLPEPVRDLLRAHSVRHDPNMETYATALQLARINLDQELLNQLVRLMDSNSRYRSTASSILEQIYIRDIFYPSPAFRKSSEEYRMALEKLIVALASAKDRYALEDSLIVFVRASAINAMLLDIPSQNIRISLRVSHDGELHGCTTLENNSKRPTNIQWTNEIRDIIPACQEWCRQALTKRFEAGNPQAEVIETNLRLVPRGPQPDVTKEAQQTHAGDGKIAPDE